MNSACIIIIFTFLIIILFIIIMIKGWEYEEYNWSHCESLHFAKGIRGKGSHRRGNSIIITIMFILIVMLIIIINKDYDIGCFDTDIDFHRCLQYHHDYLNHQYHVGWEDCPYQRTVEKLFGINVIRAEKMNDENYRRCWVQMTMMQWMLIWDTW